MRRLTRTAMTILAIAAMILGIAVTPVTADEPPPLSAVIVFHGTADTSPLHAPGFPIGNTDLTRDNGEWAFQAPVVATDFCIDADSDGNAGADCSIDAAGTLVPSLGIAGPSCGSASGIEGVGQFTASTGLRYELSNVGWLASAGGTLPITGELEHDGVRGQFVALVQAEGGEDCFGDGTEEFVIIGVAAAIQNP